LAYLNRTFSSTPTTYTMSFWVKRAKLSGGTEQVIFGCRQGASNPATFSFGTTDNILFTSGPTVTAISTTALFRDVSAWYHIVVAVTPSATSYLYVNGVQIGSWTASSNPYLFNSSYTNAIGRYGDANQNYFDGYLTEINFIDGQALTPSFFGETDPYTGRWKAKAYTGTFGNNGFYLKFADNSGTTATTLGKDSSPNGNNWTPNNFSVTAGAGNDSLVDSPTNYGTDTGLGGEVRGNYCTINPLDFSGAGTISNGNLQYVQSTLNARGGRSTIAVSSGKWYWEVLNQGGFNCLGVIRDIGAINATYIGGNADGWGYFVDGNKYNNGSASAYGASYTTNDIIGIALNMDAGTLVFYKNGVSQGTAFTGLSGTLSPAFSSSNTSAVSFTANFGQRPFAYAAPSGFKALCTQNLTQPTIQKPSTAMDVVTYTGTGASQSISSLGFSPDLVWIKGRSGATDHALYDVIRGSQARLESNTTDAEVTSDNGLTSFNSAGFTVGTLAQVNTNTATYVGWSWDAGSTNSTNTSGSITSTVRANPQAGFSIVSYTGTGANATVGHGLGVAPRLVIVKNRSAVDGWAVYHANQNVSPASGYTALNETSAFASTIASWNNTTPTSSVISVGVSSRTNGNGNNHIAYCFSEIEGYSKFGSYTGNGSADGPFVWCGFRPRWVMVKASSTGGAGYEWLMFDTARSDFNLMNKWLLANSNQAETTDVDAAADVIDGVSSGFKLRGSDSRGNANGVTYIFMAFAESPFKYARAR
jgi:hypothetical protein